MPVRLAACLTFLGLLAGTTNAQQFDRRARDEPEVVVEHGGRTGTCDVIRFSPNGDFLFAAGDDKVVRTWPHSERGLDTAPGKARVLHWRSWRDQLGGIKAIGISPDGRRVAVGGYGLRVSTVAVIDRETGATLAMTWPRVREGGANHDAVMAIAFHPDGQRIGFGTADGSLWLWTPEKLDQPAADGRTWSPPVCAGRFEPNRNKSGEVEYNFPREIHFPDANTLVSVSLNGPVLSCDLNQKLSDDPDAAAPAGKLLFDVNAGVEPRFPINSVERSADGRWIAAATKGNLVVLRSADGQRLVRIALPADHFARCIAIDAKGERLAIAVGGALSGTAPRFYMDDNDEIWVYQNPAAANPPEPKRIPHAGRAEALAFHPTLNRLAVAGGDADQITLLEPDRFGRGSWNDLAASLTSLSDVRGAGRRLYAVNLSDDGNVIGVRTGRNSGSLDPNDRGEGPWVRFNLSRFSSTADAGVKWNDVIREADGWRIVPDEHSRFIWHAERIRPDGKPVRLRLGLDSNLDQAPTCFTFVPTSPGKPARVLVGHYYGCSLFELDPARIARNERTGLDELPRARLFIGHGAEVNSIVADRLGEWFVTAGSDQTVAAWSLQEWAAQPALGAAFEVQNGRLIVAAVDVGSPAWEAGLSRGDLVDLLAVDAKRVFDRRPGREELGTAESAAKALQNPQSGVELVFGWTSGKDRRMTPTRLKQRPLWKWFPAFDERGRLTDSVMWMWHGSYYYTSSLHGDRMIGWHVNHPEVAGTPDFQPLERYKHLFLKPTVIAKLLSTRSVASALEVAKEGNAVRKKFRDVEPAPVELALKQSVVADGGVAVTVSVTPQGNNPDLIPNRVELWLNDHRMEVWTGQQARSLELTIPAAKFRAGDNHLTLLALNPVRGRAEATRFISNPAAAAKPELHGFSVGINDYSAHRQADSARTRSFGDLGRARDDAADFTKMIHEYRGPENHFPSGGMALLLDTHANRKSLKASLADLQQKQSAGKIKPDDLLIVFFAGHGDLLSPGGRVEPPKAGARGIAADSGSFVFCCPDYLPGKAAATTLSGEELFDALAEINCRKLVLLDACHAGGAVETNLLRRCIPNGQGPIVIAACDEGQKSYEDDALRHGVFTYAVLEAFGRKFRAADRNTDGTLTPEELFAYVSRQVPELMKDVKPGQVQNPVCFPRPDSLPRTALVTK